MNPEQIARDAHAAGKPWVIRLARTGLAAKGLVYVTVGALALQVALGRGGSMPDKESAVRELASQPFGTVLIAVIAGGLFGYVLWRFLQAALDPGREGALSRAGSAVSGIVYGGLALFALGILRGRTASHGNAEKHWTGRILSAPLGEWWVYLIALVILAYAGHEVYQAWTAAFRKDWTTSRMSALEARWATRAGRAGHAARAVVLAVIGAFLFSAASQHDANQAQGLDGALATLAGRSYGDALLAAVAAGLACYGIAQFVEARYRRMRA